MLRSQIINMARSPNAFIDIPFKFSTSVSFDTIQLFDKAVREFVKARPREWSKFSGFRVTKVVADRGYVGKLILRLPVGLEELPASILHVSLWSHRVLCLSDSCRLHSVRLESTACCTSNIVHHFMANSERLGRI
jgi:hypothetical protein